MGEGSYVENSTIFFVRSLWAVFFALLVASASHAQIASTSVYNPGLNRGYRPTFQQGFARYQPSNFNFGGYRPFQPSPFGFGNYSPFGSPFGSPFSFNPYGGFGGFPTFGGGYAPHQFNPVAANPYMMMSGQYAAYTQRTYGLDDDDDYEDDDDDDDDDDQSYRSYRSSVAEDDRKPVKRTPVVRKETSSTNIVVAEETEARFDEICEACQENMSVAPICTSDLVEVISPLYERAPVTSGFGPRPYVYNNAGKPISGGPGNPHKGIDIKVEVGTELRAAVKGEVLYAGHMSGYGNTLIIRSQSSGEMYLYAHLKGFAQGIEVGRNVEMGEFVASSGNTGISTGPHLHFEKILPDSSINSENIRNNIRKLKRVDPEYILGIGDSKCNE